MAHIFDLPINIDKLQNDRLRLVPLEDNLEQWATLWIRDANTHPDIYTYLTYGPFRDAAEYVAWYNDHIRYDTSTILFAILLKSGNITHIEPSTNEATTINVANDTFAGISGLVSQPLHATVDMGQMLLSEFHRTWVNRNALAVMLHHCLDPVEQGGLGLRRVQWQANASNAASVGAAKKMGFRMEAIVRWQQILPWGKEGPDGPVEAEGEGSGGAGKAGSGRRSRPGRHTAMLALCWDDWEDGGREHVNRLIGC